MFKQFLPVISHQLQQKYFVLNIIKIFIPNLCVIACIKTWDIAVACISDYKIRAELKIDWWNKQKMLYGTHAWYISLLRKI